MQFDVLMTEGHGRVCCARIERGLKYDDVSNRMLRDCCDCTCFRNCLFKGLEEHARRTGKGIQSELAELNEILRINAQTAN